MSEIMTQEMKEKLYKEAVDIMQHQLRDDKIAKARDIFLSLGDYEESKVYIEKANRYLSYQPGQSVELGEYKGKPLYWKIMKKQGRNILLFANEVVDRIPWNTERDHTNWSTCSLRRWLNKDFINEAFTLKDRMTILLVQCDNNTDSRWSVENGPATRDKLFVFTKAELDEYVPHQEDRAINEWWWLRGHGSCLLAPLAVYKDGSIYDIGVNKNSTTVGVRPAMWIRLPM